MSSVGAGNFLVRVVRLKMNWRGLTSVVSYCRYGDRRRKGSSTGCCFLIRLKRWSSEGRLGGRGRRKGLKKEARHEVQHDMPMSARKPHLLDLPLELTAAS